MSDENTVLVDRGMPSVNSQKKKSNKVAFFLFVLLVLAVVSGVAYFVVNRLQHAAQKATTSKKKEDVESSKVRTFEPALPPALQAGGSSAANADGNASPEVPAPRRESGDPYAPDAPPPIKTRNATAHGNPQGNPNNYDVNQNGQPRTNKYDTAFVVTGSAQVERQVASSANEATRPQEKNEGDSALLAYLANANKPQQPAQQKEQSQSALGGLLTPTSTPMVKAGILGDGNFTVDKGTSIECVLSKKIVVALPGIVTCRLTSPLYSANGKVVLAGRGSVVVGESNGSLKAGQARVFVLWSEIITPERVHIQINSPATDQLGASGIDGDVNNNWGQRVGGALLFSLIKDGFAYEIAKASSSSGSQNTSATGVALVQSTMQTSESLAGKILDSTINIPPTLIKMHGEMVNITVARTLDFSTVYRLESK